MHSFISRDDLQILLHEADIAARRLVRQLRLPRADLDDVRQDLLVDLIARLPAYDSDRGTLGAFAGAILANRATRIANKVRRERRMYGATPISLDEVIPESDGLTRGDLIAEIRLLLWEKPDDKMIDLMRSLRKDFDTSILFISHDLGVIAEVSDRVAVLYSGVVVEEAPTAEIFDNPRHPYTRGLLEALPQPDTETLPDMLFEIPGTVPPPEARPSGCRFHPRCPIATDRCRAEEPPIIEIVPAHRVACWEARA